MFSSQPISILLVHRRNKVFLLIVQSQRRAEVVGWGGIAKGEVYHIYLLKSTNNKLLFYVFMLASKWKAHTCLGECVKVQSENFVVCRSNFSFLPFKKHEKSMKILSYALAQTFHPEIFIYFVLFFIYFRLPLPWIVSTSNEWAHTGREWPYLLSIRSFNAVQALRFFNFLLFSFIDLFIFHFHLFFFFFFFIQFSSPARVLDLISFFFLWFGLFSIFFKY